MLEARIKLIFFFFKVEGLIFILMYYMFRYSYNKIFWGTLNFCENQQKRWGWLITFFKNAGEERVKFDMRYARWMHVSLKSDLP